MRDEIIINAIPIGYKHVTEHEKIKEGDLILDVDKAAFVSCDSEIGREASHYYMIIRRKHYV